VWFAYDRVVPHIERFNTLTHGTGALLALAGAIALVVLAALTGDPWRIVSVSVYGATLVALYTASTLYHAARGPAKAVLQKVDHGAIYLLIAGTYTPFVLGPLRGPWGWSLFGVVWGLALIGIVQDCWQVDRRRILSMILYPLMGWLAVVAVVPMMRAMPLPALGWLVAGGLSYTLGIAFFAVDRRWPAAHVVWHMFVLTGSACHYVAIARYLV
jgi:hemolysin III